MSSVTNVKQFLFSIQKDLARMNALVDAMQHQYELLNQRRSEALLSQNTEIMFLLEEIKLSHAHRGTYLLSLGLTNDKAGMETLRDRLPSPLREASTKLIEELAMKSSICNMMNERSGRLLAEQKRLLAKLIGMPDNQQYPSQLL